MELDAEALILTNEQDMGVDKVIHLLDHASIHTKRLNIETATTEPVPPIPLDPDSAYPLPSVHLVWWRQFWMDQMFDDIREADEHVVRMKQWYTWLSCLDTPNTAWVNPLWAARKAENKICQLRIANDVGFRVPKTLISNCSRQTQEFLSSVGHSVVKSLSTAYYGMSDRSFVFTSHLTEELLTLDPTSWNAQPVLIQENIQAPYDLRVIAFGGRCFGAIARRTGLDWRTDHETSWTPWECPEGIRDRIDSYLAKFGLRYAAFDFLLDGEDLWFLEANQAGEWQFLDRTLNMGIAEALAEYFSDLIYDSGNRRQG